MAEAPKLIGEFLSELAEDQELLNAYLDNQRATLDKSGLSAEQRDVLLSNDLARIREAIREEYAKAQVLVFPIPLQHILAPQNVIAPDED
jgi:hypothetical protein